MPDNEILELLSKVKLDADGKVTNVEIFIVNRWHIWKKELKEVLNDLSMCHSLRIKE